MYIVFEGIVGSGKSTQVKKLGEYLRENYLDREIVLVREPGSTPIAEDIRFLAQGKEWEGEKMHPLTNAYLYAAARAQTLHMIVVPALERGAIVISDRSFISSCVIQGEAQGVGINKILWINKEAVGKIIPDIIFYLEVDIDTALSRTFDEGRDKFEKEGRKFYKKIVKGYEKLAKWKKLEGKFVRIDANKDQDSITRSLVQEIYKNIGL